MHNHIDQVGDHPASPWIAFDLDGLAEFFFSEISNGCGHGVQHPVGSAVTDDEITGKGGYGLNIEEYDLFRFFFLEKIYQASCFFYRFQGSPHFLIDLNFITAAAVDSGCGARALNRPVRLV